MRVEDLQSYELIEKRRIDDLNTESYLLRHRKTGARVGLLSNDDENKVFYIGFRTPPTDDTGVAHILEHSVLCGSRNFPVKDPFVELVKGSLNTFLNAMTYPDKTVYPLASCNDVDFQNLMHVYLDAVFYPNIYKQKKIFCQEGWHYDMEDAQGELTINGVVYSEMKGVFSAPDDLLEREVMNSLYPDTTYGRESGGDPEKIPELSYEEFLDFHRKYYHPSNSYIYLYGNMDMAEKLEFIDREYLSAFEARQVDSRVEKQQPFAQIREVEREYPINDEEDPEKTAYLAYNAVVGDVLDRDLYVAFQILDYALCSAPGAPLKEALIERGIGEEVYSSYDNGVLQPYFSIVAKNTSTSRRQEFVDTICGVLMELAEKGLDKRALLAGINYYEFRYREADFGSWPKGLMYGLQMFDSWLYDDNKPFLHIEANETFGRMRKLAEGDGFEEIIRRYLLDNTHKSLVTLVPKKGLAAVREQELKEKLMAYRSTLSEDKIRQIVAETAALEEWQEMADSKEDLEKIPMLSRGDMKKEAPQYVNEVRSVEDPMGSTTVLFHDLFTNEIAYLRLMFRADKVPEELFPYLGLLKGALGLLNTENYKYGALFHEVNIATGGISPVCNIYSKAKDPKEYTVMLELKTRVLYSNLGKAMELMEEMLLRTKYDDSKRLGEILSEGRAKMQGQMISGGHQVAAERAMSYISTTAAVSDVLLGRSFYKLVDRLSAGGAEEMAELGRKLQLLAHIIFRPENLMVDFVGTKEGYQPLPGLVSRLKGKLFTMEVPGGSYQPEVIKKNEGFKTAGQVQYVCRAGNFKKKGLEYHGSLRVLKVMLGCDYLWNNVRVKGGAYGCMCGFGKSGDSYFVSYRDPNLTKTIDIYEKAADYIASFEADERTLTQFIIGAISDLDIPMNPAAKGVFSLSGYMTGLTQEDLQRERDELLATDRQTFQKTAEYIRAFMEDECLCVVGGNAAVEETKEIFDTVENLF